MLKGSKKIVFLYLLETKLYIYIYIDTHTGVCV